MAEIPKSYEPQGVEQQWYDRWVAAGCFKGKVDHSRESFAVMIPPPNVTGVLHMGHLLNNTLQDIMVRRARQEGKSALWLPGTDHAGIATQSRVEKELRQKEGKTRHDLGREKFVQVASEWRDKHGGIILGQLRKLGASCDWDRTVHTLDAGYSQAVLQTFVTLYERGYVYRGKRMVNWCPVSQTGLSDEEVIMKPSKGSLYRMRYEVAELPGTFLEISTTRPETIPGDAAVAVHPDDERYKHLIGKHVWRPFPRAQIPIVGDTAVEKEFGTGVLKVTPAHDRTDFDIGKRHDLPVIDVMNPDGTMNADAGPLAGLERFKARHAAEKLLEELGALVKTEPYENTVGFSERADVPIEPRLSEQWFIRYPKIDEAKRAVTSGIIKFHPERWTKTYLHWLENIQDWCVSRQLWWGHRIPVWYRKGADRNDPKNLHVSLTAPADAANWEQDDDVLDTWASSWLWCLATIGWRKPGETTEELKHWYPTGALATGPDIIFLWVARMIIAGLELHGPEKKTLTDDEIRQRIPFKRVYFNGIIRDKLGRKMSKSLGNSPEPLDLIAKFGADGLRFGLLSIAPKGQDILFDEDRVGQGRNFCNKLWNAARFRQMSGPMADNSTLAAVVSRIKASQLDDDDFAILQGLAELTDSTAKNLDEHEFTAYAQGLYAFFWGDFCDWYVEASKARLRDPALVDNCLAVQDLVLRQFLLLLHPVAPFISEELWHLLGYGTEKDFIQDHHTGTGGDLLRVLRENGIKLSAAKVADVALLREFVASVRGLKSQANQATRRDAVITVVAKDATAKALLAANREKLSSLAGLSEIGFADDAGDRTGSLTSLGTVMLELSGTVDVAAEKVRLAKELAKLEQAVAAGEAKLTNEAFVSKAPPKILEGARKQLDEAKAKRDEIARMLTTLG
ncbi:MAG: valine--tRNA ligase [Opitutales bacterium]|jgi:valyl-tRNA synthetase|nr:valine--tRNA ligase [Opitutales bacterium]